MSRLTTATSNGHLCVGAHSMLSDYTLIGRSSIVVINGLRLSVTLAQTKHKIVTNYDYTIFGQKRS